MDYIFNEYSDSDIDVLRKQLDTDNIRITGIIERCCWGYPSIVMLYPVRENEYREKGKKINFQSLSTLIWLTCPYMNRRIHELESMGYIEKITRFMEDDSEIASKMKYSHAHYFFLRKKVFRYFLGDVTSIDENTRLFETGIGGVGNISNIKCLHIHYAHYKICDHNVVGQITTELLKREIYCKERICDYDGR